MKKLFLLAGEISGDTHGSGLMESLRAMEGDVKFLGYGGPRMKQIGGAKMQDWVEDAGVVGLWEVVKMYGWFKQKMSEALATIAAESPDAVVLIDYPGFNLRIAQVLRDAGYKQPIIYYISPQVWAWKKGRVKTMARVLDLMICIFPFEKDFYEKSGLPTVFAGHPMVDRVKTLSKGLVREPGLAGFFPGSRSNEVRRLFPVMLAASRLIRQRMPQARFAVSAANEKLARMMYEMADAAGMPEARDWIEVGTVYDLMQKVQAGAVASGTATLEAACFGLPYVLVYKVNLMTYILGKAIVRIKYLGIVNILAGKPVVKEMVQGQLSPENLCEELLQLMNDEATRSALVDRLSQTAGQLGEGGAYQRAAQAVMEQLARAAKS